MGEYAINIILEHMTSWHIYVYIYVIQEKWIKWNETEMISKKTQPHNACKYSEQNIKQSLKRHNKILEFYYVKITNCRKYKHCKRSD